MAEKNYLSVKLHDPASLENLQLLFTAGSLESCAFSAFLGELESFSIEDESTLYLKYTHGEIGVDLSPRLEITLKRRNSNEKSSNEE